MRATCEDGCARDEGVDRPLPPHWPFRRMTAKAELLPHKIF